MTEHYINLIAERSAKAIGLDFTPRFFRWNSSRGWAHRHNRKYSLPRWIQNRSDTLKIAYIAHEVAHFHPESMKHGVKFRENEIKALAAWFIVPVYRPGETYAVAFRDSITNETLCDGHGL